MMLDHQIKQIFTKDCYMFSDVLILNNSKYTPAEEYFAPLFYCWCVFVNVCVCVCVCVQTKTDHAAIKGELKVSLQLKALLWKNKKRITSEAALPADNGNTHKHTDTHRSQ